jgi:hypothetical protein
MNIALYLFTGLSVLVDLALGAWAGVFWRSFAETWHLDATAGRDAQLLGLVLALCLVFFAALQALALLWIRREKEEGHQVLIAFGFYLIVSSVITFVVFRRSEFLLLDGVRGMVLAVLSATALRSPASVRGLRLPVSKAEPVRPQRAEWNQGRPRDRRTDDPRGRRDLQSSGPGAAAPGPGGRDGRQRDPDRGRRRSARGPRGREGEERGGRISEPRGNDDPRDRALPHAGPDAAGSSRVDRLIAARERSESGRIWTSKVDRHARAPEEANSGEPLLPKRPRPDGEDRPLTVVVKGKPEDHRVRPAEEDAGVRDFEPGPEAEPGAARPGSGERRRRHRRRRREPSSSGAAERFTQESEEELLDRASEDAVTAAEDEGPPPARTAGPAEALDMLSLLDPGSERGAQTDRDREGFGRRQRPARGRRGPAHSPPTRSEGNGSSEDPL